jgi:hypothetical protein
MGELIRDAFVCVHDHQDVTRKIDLARLCRVGEEANTLDLHVNYAPSYLPVVRERAVDLSSQLITSGILC